MADLKISQMTDGGLVETTDEIPINRGGQNHKVKVGEASTYNVGSGDSDLPTGLDVTNKINSQGFITFSQDSSGDDFYPQADGSEILNVKIPVSATDTLSEYLVDKIKAGSGVTITKLDNAGVEYLEISSSGGGSGNLINGNVQLRDNSGTPTLYPLNGGDVIVNGNQYKLSSSIALTSNSPTNSTNYYSYLEENGSGGLNLIHSTTAYTFNSNGIPVMTGDATKTFVGMVRRLTGAWATTSNFLRSYYNDKGFVISNSFITNRSINSTSYIEINSEIRGLFLSWADEIINLSLAGTHFNTTTNSTVSTTLSIDSTTVPLGGESRAAAYGNGAASIDCSIDIPITGLSEGVVHTASVLGRVSANTGTWTGAASDPNRTVLYVSSSGRK